MDEDNKKKLLENAKFANKLDWDSLGDKKLFEFADITLKVNEASAKWIIQQTLMKAFLMYSVACAVTILLGTKYEVQPIVLAFSNIALAALLAFIFQLRSTQQCKKITCLVAEHEKFLNNVAKQHSGEKEKNG